MINSRICIVGGGIAGSTLAYVLSNYFDYIDLFEADDKLLTGASNLWWCRIHTGNHFPHQAQRGKLTCTVSYATAPFYQNFFASVKKPQYFCAKSPLDQLVIDGELLTPEKFIDYVKWMDSLATETSQKFPLGAELLGAPFWNFVSPDDPSYPKSAGVGIDTNEGVLDLPKLATSFRTLLRRNDRVQLFFKTTVKSIEKVRPHKYLVAASNKMTYEYDYVINCTRALPIHQLDDSFRKNSNLIALPEDDRPELRFYSVLEKVRRDVDPCHQYVHGNKGISYAYFPKTNLAIVEALPETIIKYGDSNSDLASWLAYTRKQGPINHSDYQILAERILELSKEEYPSLSQAEIFDYYAAPMVQPSEVEHRDMHKLFFETAGKKARIDPEGYFYVRNLKVTDTILCAFHILQQLCIKQKELGFQKQALRMTTVDFLTFLMKEYPEEHILREVRDSSNYRLSEASAKQVENYC